MATLPCSTLGFAVYNVKAGAYIWFGHAQAYVLNRHNSSVVRYPEGK